MNQGRWKRFWTWCQKIFGAGWIHLVDLQPHARVRARARRSRFARASHPAGCQSSIVLRYVRGVDRALPSNQLAQATLLSGARPVLLPIAAGSLCEPGHGMVVDVSAILRVWRKSDSREARF